MLYPPLTQCVLHARRQSHVVDHEIMHYITYIRGTIIMSEQRAPFHDFFF